MSVAPQVTEASVWTIVIGCEAVSHRVSGHDKAPDVVQQVAVILKGTSRVCNACLFPDAPRSSVDWRPARILGERPAWRSLQSFDGPRSRGSPLLHAERDRPGRSLRRRGVARLERDSRGRTGAHPV